MFYRRIKKMAMALYLLVVMGCSYQVGTYQEPILTFDHIVPQNVIVGKITVEGAEQDDGFYDRNIIPHSFANLVKAKLQASGDSGLLTFSIDKADIIDEGQLYRAVLVVKANLYNEADQLIKSSLINANRTVSIPWYATLTDRDQLRFEMVETMMMDIEPQLTVSLASPKTR
jgi:hypothetical protein